MSDITITQEIKTTSTVIMPLAGGFKAIGTVRKYNNEYDFEIKVDADNPSVFSLFKLNKHQASQLRQFLHALMVQLPSNDDEEKKKSEEYKRRMMDEWNKTVSMSKPKQSDDIQRFPTPFFTDTIGSHQLPSNTDYRNRCIDKLEDGNDYNRPA